MVFVPKSTTSCVFEQGNKQEIPWNPTPTVSLLRMMSDAYIFAAVPLRCSELLFRFVPPALPWQRGSKQNHIGGKNAKWFWQELQHSAVVPWIISFWNKGLSWCPGFMTVENPRVCVNNWFLIGNFPSHVSLPFWYPILGLPNTYQSHMLHVWYSIFTNIWEIFRANVGQYSIHGAYGNTMEYLSHRS